MGQSQSLDDNLIQGPLTLDELKQFDKYQFYYVYTKLLVIDRLYQQLDPDKVYLCQQNYIPPSGTKMRWVNSVVDIYTDENRSHYLIIKSYQEYTSVESPLIQQLESLQDTAMYQILQLFLEIRASKSITKLHIFRKPTSSNCDTLFKGPKFNILIRKEISSADEIILGMKESTIEIF